MPLDKKLHKRIMKEGNDVFKILENYDSTREWPIGRKRIDITLSKKTIKRLKELKEKTGRSVSRIIEDAVAEI